MPIPDRLVSALFSISQVNKMIWSAAEPPIPVPAYGGYQSWVSQLFPKWGNKLAMVSFKSNCINIEFHKCDLIHSRVRE